MPAKGHQVFEIVREIATWLRDSHLAASAPDRTFAAPFDIPCSVKVQFIPEQAGNDRVVLEFRYALGDNEPSLPAKEQGNALVSFGKLSGRVMKVELFNQFDGAMRSVTSQLESLLSNLPQKPGTPLRKVAHYQLLRDDVLPGLAAFMADKLPALRARTNR